MLSKNCCGACRCPGRAGEPDELGVIEGREVEFSWRPSQLTRAIASGALVAWAAAVIGAHWQLIAFAAPLLGVLCSISWQRPVPTIHVHGEPDSQRRFENEQAQLTVWVTEDAGAHGASAVELTVVAVEGMQ